MQPQLEHEDLTDPKETDNVAVKNPKITQRLTKPALAWRKSLP